MPFIPIRLFFSYFTQPIQPAYFQALAMDINNSVLN